MSQGNRNDGMSPLVQLKREEELEERLSRCLILRHGRKEVVIHSQGRRAMKHLSDLLDFRIKVRPLNMGN